MISINQYAQSNFIETHPVSMPCHPHTWQSWSALSHGPASVAGTVPWYTVLERRHTNWRIRCTSSPLLATRLMLSEEQLFLPLSPHIPLLPQLLILRQYLQDLLKSPSWFVFTLISRTWNAAQRLIIIPLPQPQLQVMLVSHFQCLLMKSICNCWVWPSTSRVVNDDVA